MISSVTSNVNTFSSGQCGKFVMHLTEPPSGTRQRELVGSIRCSSANPEYDVGKHGMDIFLIYGDSHSEPVICLENFDLPSTNVKIRAAILTKLEAKEGDIGPRYPEVLHRVCIRLPIENGNCQIVWTGWNKAFTSDPTFPQGEEFCIVFSVILLEDTPFDAMESYRYLEDVSARLEKRNAEIEPKNSDQQQQSCCQNNELVKNLMSAFESEELADIKLLVADRVFRCNSAILSFRSPVFKTAFYGSNLIEKITGIFDFKEYLNDFRVKPECVLDILRWCYTGEVEVLNHTNAKDLFKLSHFLQMKSLFEKCQEELRKVISLRSKRNVSESVSEALEIAFLAFTFAPDSVLLTEALEFILFNFSEVKASSGWKNFASDDLKREMKKRFRHDPEYNLH